MFFGDSLSNHFPNRFDVVQCSLSCLVRKLEEIGQGSDVFEKLFIGANVFLQHDVFGF